MTMLTSKKIRTTALAIASCFSILTLPAYVEAAGMGKIKVLSALGEPLRAEIDVIASKDELQGMSVRLASPEAFDKVGIEYAHSLTSVRFSLEKRTNGQPYVLVQSERPLNDPFINLLVELDWPTGRLMREYHFLLNPQDIALDADAGLPIDAPTVAQQESLPEPPPAMVREPTPPPKPQIAEASPAETTAKEAPVKRERTRKPPEEKVVAEPSVATSGGGGASTHTVEKGETLSQIASNSKHAGVTLEQMLVAIVQANEDAFINGNMNLLKTGKILTIPDEATVAAIEPTEARKVYRTQTTEWNDYRKKVADAAADSKPIDDSQPGQTGGRITQVDAKEPVSKDRGDVVQIAKAGDQDAKTPLGATGKSSATEDEIASMKKELEDFRKKDKVANDAIKEQLERIDDLTKQLAIQNEQLKRMQDQAQQPVAPPPVVAPTEPPVAETKPPEPTTPEVVTPPDETSPTMIEPEPIPPPVAVVKPPPKPVIPPPPAPVTPEESSHGLLLGIVGAVILGGGLIAYLMRRRRGSGDTTTSTSLIDDASGLGASSMGVNSVFRSTGGQNIDTASSGYSRPHTDFSQAGPGQIDTDEVDPVAEADVYMAYGRDPQAEEILLEALQKEPRRLAIHLKLLEIYSLRGNLKQFETLATELYEITGGTGPDWEKAAALGAKLDPKNPLYGSSARQQPAHLPPDSEDFPASETDIGYTAKSTVTMPGRLAQMAGTAAASEIPSAFDESSVLDFGPSQPADDYSPGTGLPSDFSFDLDEPSSEAEPNRDLERTAPLGNVVPPPPRPVAPRQQPPSGSAGTATQYETNVTSSILEPMSTGPVSGLDDEFNFDLTSSEVLSSLGETTVNQPVAPGMGATGVDSTFQPFDLGAIDLDLEKDGGEGQDEVATKLDLAKAYEDMGDIEGARELLQEVVDEGNPEQKKAAQTALSRLTMKS